MRKLPVVPICRSSEFHKSTILAAFHSNGGAGRDRHERGMECDGRGCAARRAARMRTAKACGPGALVAGAKFAEDDPRATVTQKPVSPGRARRSLLKPSRRECRCFGFICGDYACVLSTLHTRLRVQPNTWHSLRPLLFEAHQQCLTRVRSRREKAKSCLTTSLTLRRRRPHAASVFSTSLIQYEVP
jgi:hypothetical protein